MNYPEKRGEAHLIWGVRLHISFCTYLFNSLKQESDSLYFQNVAFTTYKKHEAMDDKNTLHTRNPQIVKSTLSSAIQNKQSYVTIETPLSLWESILNKAVRLKLSLLKIINERPIMVPLDLPIKFINELSIRYSGTKMVAYRGIFNAIKVHH